MLVEAPLTSALPAPTPPPRGVPHAHAPPFIAAAAAVVLLLTGCASYDETAHRAATAEALGVDELDDGS